MLLKKHAAAVFRAHYLIISIISSLSPLVHKVEPLYLAQIIKNAVISICSLQQQQNCIQLSSVTTSRTGCIHCWVSQIATCSLFWVLFDWMAVWLFCIILLRWYWNVLLDWCHAKCVLQEQLGEKCPSNVSFVTEVASTSCLKDICRKEMLFSSSCWIRNII